MKKILIPALLAAAAFAGCQKTDFDETVMGEAIGAFTLNAPVTNATIALNAATPTSTIEITWSAAKPGIDIVPTYKWVAALKANGTLESPLLEIASDNGGKDAKLTVTHKQLDDALKAKGIADGAKAELIWSVKAENGSSTLLATEARNITINRMKDGATAFILLGPATSGDVNAIDPNSTGQALKFNWTRSRPANGGPVMKYKVLFAERKLDADGNVLAVDWTKPLIALDADNAGIDSIANFTYKAISDSLKKKGFENEELPVDLLWTVVGTSGTWAQYAEYVNQVVILREIKVFIVGSATPAGWTIEKASRLIPDPRFPGTFFTYLYMTGGGEFKFVNGQQWPPAPGIIDWGQDKNGPAGTITDNDEANIAVATSGVYRVTFDYPNKKYYVQSAASGGIGGLGIVGDFQTPGWTPAANVRMSSPAPNKMIVFQQMGANNGFKFHDGNEWDNGANNKSRWFGPETEGGTKLIVDGGGAKNVTWTGAAGLVRVIFDGGDVKNLTYNLSPVTEMRMVGEGLTGVPSWEPAQSPQMTYLGEGKWELVVDFIAGKKFKFLAGNAWGALDYESVGDGKINYNGGSDFDTPGSGKYTVTLDEYMGTVTFKEVK